MPPIPTRQPAAASQPFNIDEKVAPGKAGSSNTGPRACKATTYARRTRYVVALTSVTSNGTLHSAVRFNTRVSNGAEPDQTVCAVKPLGGSSVVQMSRAMVCTPEASVLGTHTQL